MKDTLIWNRGFLPHTRAFKDSSLQAPEPRNLTREMMQTLAGDQATAPGFLALNQQFQPLYTQLGLDNTATTMQGYTDENGVVHPGTTALDQAANTSNRISNTNDLGLIGPGVTGSILNANPWLNNSANSLSTTLSTLSSQADAGLKSNGALSPTESRDLNQAALSSFGSAGISSGNSAIAAQLFARDAAVRQRQQQAQGFAESVAGLNNTATNTFSNVFTNPILQILGMGNLTPGATGSGTPTTGSTVSTANSLFNPQSSYAQDLYNTNYSGAFNTSVANANNASASNSMWASLLGALISDDRVKRSIHKTDEATREGIPLSTWIYKTDPKKRRWKGVLASDVEKVRPDAVLTDPISGLRAVDYGALGATMSIHERLLAREAA